MRGLLGHILHIGAWPESHGIRKTGLPPQEERGQCFLLPILQRRLPGVSHAFMLGTKTRTGTNGAAGVVGVCGQDCHMGVRARS
jgi:hypothetical protein